MPEEQNPAASPETVEVPGERVQESYSEVRVDKNYATTSQRSYSAPPAAPEQEPPLPREAGLFAAVPPWDPPEPKEPAVKE
jgi:hypothetical protein